MNSVRSGRESSVGGVWRLFAKTFLQFDKGIEEHAITQVYV